VHHAGRVVGGERHVRAAASFPALTTSTSTALGQGLFFFSNTALTSLSLPVLTNVGGTLSVDTNTALTSLNLSVLARTGTMLNISGTALTSLACTRFPAVTLTHAAAQTPMQMRVQRREGARRDDPARRNISQAWLVISGNAETCSPQIVIRIDPHAGDSFDVSQERRHDAAGGDFSNRTAGPPRRDVHAVAGDDVFRLRLPRAQSTSSQICISSRHCLSHEPVTA
jgi:hypothetical protein